jgi:aminoglycoside phosphotransferase (APT) family kinase protein
VSPHWVDDEARIAKAICDAGVPAPAPGELLEIDGRRGLLYERVEGISMLEDMNARPWLIFKYARSLADLHIHINKQMIAGLPSYKNRLHWDIHHSKHLETELQNRLFQKLVALPDGNNLCHGDYHPGNVLLSKDGPVVIDWVTASAGSPWVDVARTSMILSIGAKGAKNQVRPIIRMIIKLYHRAYVSRYRAQVRDSENELNSWRPLIAAARLNEEISPEREALLDMAKEI